MTQPTIAQATYINLETLRKDGTGVKTPVWQTYENGTFYVWTQANSGKVKRIRNQPQVRLCPCDARGNAQGEWITGQARILDASAEPQQRRRMAAKYGLFFQAFRLVGLLRRTAYAVIAITPN